MDWQFKNLVFQAFDTFPPFGGLYQLAHRLGSQRHVPRLTHRSLKSYMIPVERFKEMPRARTAFEFGAGRGLITPLLLKHAGAETIYAYDLQRLASVRQVNAVIGQLEAVAGIPGAPIQSLDDLAKRYSIIYRAPGDARDTGLPDGSVDLVYSTATLEHIPPDQIRQILSECRRILQPEGRMSFTIDYHDHYASSDRAIGFMNFYQFGDEEWRKYNSGRHFQNRLRHSDYISLFEEVGLRVLAQTPIFDEWSERDLERVQLHPRFERYSHQDLTASNGLFLLGLR
jgi:SAM-dependent methyltransferase